MDIKENWMPLAIAALLGTSGGGGVATFLGQHTHPEIIHEIREVQYEAEIFKLESQVDTMETAGHKDSASYAVAVAQLIKFKEMLVELGQ